MIHVSTEKLDCLQKLIQDLQNSDWKKRFGAGFKLEVRANELGKFAETLQAMALDNQSPGKYTAVWLLKQLGEKTTRLRKTQYGFCGVCLIKWR